MAERGRRKAARVLTADERETLARWALGQGARRRRPCGVAALRSAG